MNLKIKLSALVVILLAMTGCTRYSYIPRQHNLFGLNKTNKQESPTKHEGLKKKPSQGQQEVNTDSIVVAWNSSEKSKGTRAINNSVLFPSPFATFKNAWNNEPLKKQFLKYRQGKTISSNRRGLVLNPLKRKPLKNLQGKDDDKKEFDILSLVSLLLGVVALASLVLAFSEIYLFTEYLLAISIVSGLAALITGIIALSQTKENRHNYNNRFMALIGLIMGAVELAIMIVIFIFLFILLSIFGLI